MRETAERHVELRANLSSDVTVDRLEQEAERMYQQGWRYTGSHVDAVFENVVLCFERELDTRAIAS
jgi:hypothetical protein